MMRNWLDSEKEYLQADLTLSGLVPAKVDDQVVTALFGDGTEFTYDQMNKVMKDQWKAKAAEGRSNRYIQYADIRRARRTSDNLYSRDVALKAVQERTEYLLNRGSTVNNRKIYHSYVAANCAELKNTAWVRSLEAAVNTEMELEPPPDIMWTHP